MSFTILQSEKTPFQAIKTTSSKSRKLDIFPEGLTHSFGPKLAIFLPYFFQAIQARKMLFTIIQSEKTPFQALKTTSSKSRKLHIFPEGLTHSFGPKLAVFPTFFFRKYRPGKCLLRYSRAPKRFFWAIKTRRPKSRKIEMFPKRLTHGFGRIMAIFPTFYFRQYKTGKCLLRYSKEKKRLSKL